MKCQRLTKQQLEGKDPVDLLKIYSRFLFDTTGRVVAHNNVVQLNQKWYEKVNTEEAERGR